MALLYLEKIRTLHVQRPSGSLRPPFISSASGLVAYKDRFFVIADDEIQLSSFEMNHVQAGLLFPILPGELPETFEKRKKTKPDFESLVLFGNNPPKLLALGSGSKPNRMSGAVIQLLPDGSQIISINTIDLTPLYQAISEKIGELNIEGCVFLRNEVLLFQRGNQGKGKNSIIKINREQFETGISEQYTLQPSSITGIVEIHLGYCNGVPYSFTDATLSPDGRILYAAAAENTPDAYQDGEVIGCSIGIIDSVDKTPQSYSLTQNTKIEGIAYLGSELFGVSDSDAPNMPSELFRIRGV